MKDRTGTRPGRRLRHRTLFCAALFLAGFAGWLLSFLWSGPQRAWPALLAGFLFFISLAGGLVAWPAIIHAAGGTWARKHEDVPAAAIVFLPFGLAVLLLLWAAGPAWAPWYGKATPQGLWLENTVLFARQIAGLLLFWGMAWFFLRRKRFGGGRAAAALCLLAFSAAFSLIGFDLVMALDYHWHSSLFGGYFFISALYIGIAAWGLIAARLPETESPFRGNVAGLVLAFSVLTVYMLFSQLLPIWYENLARETSFLYARLSSAPARQITFALLVIVYLAPPVMLLTRRARQSRVVLGLSCGIILGGMWLERWWLVAPTLLQQPAIGVAEVAAAATFAGLLGGGMMFSLRNRDAGREGPP
jgi:hypothetical protein